MALWHAVLRASLGYGLIMKLQTKAARYCKSNKLSYLGKKQICMNTLYSYIYLYISYILLKNRYCSNAESKYQKYRPYYMAMSH